MLAHVAHWLWAGSTLSPVEPSEAMYTLNKGYLNAGAIFFALAILSTLIFGRFLCGWGCHVVAYQDLCAWLLRKIGIRPKPFRSRLLVFAPLALAIYMFVWPTVYRVWLQAPAPPLANHLVTTEFWATFPGPLIAILTLLVCGFGIVYFLGSKGFCTYGCPYGGFFGLVEPLAPGRILVTDACNHCGHCTSACTSNVRVHEEVAKFGMVVDPGCMKCMDCVSVCPNDALHFGFARPAVAARPTAPLRARVYDFSLAEEAAAVVIGLAALLALRGLYGQIPLLFAMGLSAMTAYAGILLLRLVGGTNVRWQNLQLKRGRKWTRAGIVFATSTVCWLSLTIHSGVIQYSAARGTWIVSTISLTDDLWKPGFDWWAKASARDREVVDRALRAFEQVERWGLMVTPDVLPDQARLYLAKGDTAAAERVVRRFIVAAPGEPAGYRGLANVLRKANRIGEAIEAYRAALRVNPAFTEARGELCGALESAGRFDEAEKEYEAAIKAQPNDLRSAIALGEFYLRRGDSSRATAALQEASSPTLASSAMDAAGLRTRLAVALMGVGDVDGGVAQFRKVIELDPGSGDAQYNLGYAMLTQGKTAEAIPFLRRAVALRSDVALWHYNLGVATFMTGDAVTALPAIREAIRISPHDPQMHGFLSVLLDTLGDSAGAAEARARAEQLDAPR